MRAEGLEHNGRYGAYGNEWTTPMQDRHPDQPFRVGSELKGSHFTDLFASISEEDDGYTVQVRLYDQTKPENAAWGEEIADSFETASMLVGALAAEFSIPQARITIEIRMNNMTDGTRH